MTQWRRASCPHRERILCYITYRFIIAADSIIQYTNCQDTRFNQALPFPFLLGGFVAVELLLAGAFAAGLLLSGR